MKNFYPFTLCAIEHHFIESPRLALKLWTRDRKSVAPDLVWYALDLEVTSASSVTVHVRDMKNSFSGGVGKAVFRYEPTLDLTDLADLAHIIRKEQSGYAAREWEHRKEQRGAAEIEAVRVEMFGADHER